jgi:hypothetical protein
VNSAKGFALQSLTQLVLINKSFEMKKRPDYLLAVMPSLYIINLIREWKLLLLDEVGNFGSAKSLAHFTIATFKDQEN